MVLLDANVWFVGRVLRADALHYLLLHRFAARPSVDELGAYFVESAPCVDDSLRLVSVTGACTVTGLWSIRSGSRVYVIPKY